MSKWRLVAGGQAPFKPSLPKSKAPQARRNFNSTLFAELSTLA